MPQENAADLMRQLTGSEVPGTLVGQTDEHKKSMHDTAWRVLREALSHEKPRPVRDGDAMVVIGASWDIMIDDAKRLRELTKGVRPRIYYLGGMRPFDTEGDARGARTLGVPKEEARTMSETDMIRKCIVDINQAEFVDSEYRPGNINEVKNELGERTVTHEYYRTKDGVEIVLVNGGAVARYGGGKPRHTTRSVAQELFETMPFDKDKTVHIMATYPFAERITLECMLAAMQSGVESALCQYPVIPPRA